MNASARWLNDYLDPPCTTQEQADLLTAHAFPIERIDEVDAGSGTRDERLVVEVTSNRGDCLSHVALAREVAAAGSRALRPPAPENRPSGPKAASLIRVINHEPGRCPLYTARVMRGVTVRPSPPWLAERLRAIGQIPRNNIVDATNFVLFELGQPTHVFDLAKIKGGEINIRMARPRERFLPIGEGEKEVELSEHDLVIADAKDAVAIGGIKGGAHSAVTSGTRDILIEAATFDPVSVRRSARRHRIESGSAYRFERGVHPAFVNRAAERLVEIVLQTAGGELCEGSVADGAAIPPARQVTMRTSRCQSILGIDLPAARMIELLARLGFEPRASADQIACTIPVDRLDIEREIDLIEEVARLNGFHGLPVAETIAIRVAPPQPRVQAKRVLGDTLAGMGFVEAITHSLIADSAAEAFQCAGATVLRVADDRARSEPALRPSIVPSLLRVRAHNEDQGVAMLALFEIASTFCEENGTVREAQRLALLCNVNDRTLGMRPLRGAIEAVASAVAGNSHAIAVSPCEGVRWLAPAAQARLFVGEDEVGWLGMIDDTVAARFGGDGPVMAAELDLVRLLSLYPPGGDLRPLPAFPPIERDISAIVHESVKWQQVQDLIESLRLDMLEAVEFVGTFRGKQIGEEKKSLTLRLRFRSERRTLTHDEVNPQMEAAMNALQSKLNATIRK